MDMKQLLLRHYTTLMAAAAFIVWGGWATFVNADAGTGQRIVSGLTQGTISAVSTVTMIWVIELLYRKLEGVRLRILLPSVMPTLILGVILVTAHQLAGTEHIVWTVTPNLVIVFIFGMITTFKVRTTVAQ